MAAKMVATPTCDSVTNSTRLNNWAEENRLGIKGLSGKSPVNEQEMGYRLLAVADHNMNPTYNQLVKWPNVLTSDFLHDGNC